MLPVEIGRALHVFVPSVWQALDISYTAATDLGHRGFADRCILLRKAS
jgi:hypothetical protein